MYVSGPTNGRPARCLSFPFCPLSLLPGEVFGTARSGQGRAVFARRSEPLTARTVPEGRAGGKGGERAGTGLGSDESARRAHGVLAGREERDAREGNRRCPFLAQAATSTKRRPLDLVRPSSCHSHRSAAPQNDVRAALPPSQHRRQGRVRQREQFPAQLVQAPVQLGRVERRVDRPQLPRLLAADLFALQQPLVGRARLVVLAVNFP